MSEELTLDDLDVIWMEDGLPCFFGDRHDICDVVESFGFNIYYIMANETKEIKPSTTASKSYTTAATAAAPPAPIFESTFKIFKVVNNFVGRSVSMEDPAFNPQEFISMNESCVYNMPLIPYVLIEKLDQFFRLVDSQHGTESIVMLTYDMDKQGPDGWGILVPDQTNTSVHCNYDPDSIAQIKPDNVMIVGSVHSHPGMAAYASGTDHDDQADFDGLHITFGWQKSVNNGATQYHIELQMSGSTYTLKPEDVFQDYLLDKAPDSEVVGWTDKVKKVSPPSMGGSVTVTPGEAYQTPRPPAMPKTQDSTAAGTSHKNTYYIVYPVHISQIFENHSDIDMDSLIVCEAYESSLRENANFLTCPACLTILPRHSVYATHSCNICDVPLSEPDTSAEQIIWDMFDYCKERNIPTDSALYLYTKRFNGETLLMRLTPTTMDDYANGQWADVDAPTTDITLCCSSPKHQCYCETQVLPLDSIDFDSFIGSINVYQTGSDCSSCFNYYDTVCPSYRELVVDFISNPKKRNAIHYEGTISGVDCSSFRSYLTDDYERDYS